MTEVIIRAASSAGLEALPLMQVAAGALFRELDMDLVADGPTPPADAFLAAQAVGALLIAVSDESVVGFVRMKPPDNTAHVDQVTAAPQAKRGGSDEPTVRRLSPAPIGREPSLATSAHDVAAAVLERVGPIEAMQLETLVYYSQAWHLALLDEPVFPGTIQAWHQGPVAGSAPRAAESQPLADHWPNDRRLKQRTGRLALV